MYVRRAFTVFLEVQSEAAPHTEAINDWTLDWRWFCEAADDPALPSERSLIDWSQWARLRTPRRGSSAPR